MATLREYFDTDNPVMREHVEWTLKLPDGDVSVIAKMHYDFTANAKYWSVFVPANADPIGVVTSLIEKPWGEALGSDLQIEVKE